ncbi:hypothetical protein E2C01_098866 [Portunus trituberculatus]|uniref:Uncharacterized protein n=1 Tax=Portunus trituberculatus TaxID=210409 RepID=A0A5B7K825_PORTR|nr:hypothetical protein [Portunus trituberculatus]
MRTAAFVAHDVNSPSCIVRRPSWGAESSVGRRVDGGAHVGQKGLARREGECKIKARRNRRRSLTRKREEEN